MDITQLLPIAAFGAIAILFWLIVSHFNSKSSRASERLDELRDPTLRSRETAIGSDATGVGGMFEKAAPALSKAMGAKTELEQSKLKTRLANAGYNAPNAGTFFLALKVIVGGIGLAIGAGYGMSAFGLTQNGYTSIVIGGGLGFYIPEIGLWWKRRSRVGRIFLSLPDALDLLVVCVEAGLGLDAAMRRVAEELHDTAPDVCDEFARSNMEMQMGRARREVLHDLGVRTGVDDMRALAAILIQADKFGSSIAQALRVQSDSMRVKRSQIAEEKAAKTAVQMIFPLVLFIFPGIFVVLVGPAAIMMMNQLLNTNN
ncbi:MAG: secretion protein [Planctomycetaceae bacterium]|nr:secretion protein [Planctomycetaceae bacterium]